MKFRHKIRDLVLKAREIYYKRILRKPRIYYIKHHVPRSFYGYYNAKTKYLNKYFMMRHNKTDLFEKYKGILIKILNIFGVTVS